MAYILPSAFLIGVDSIDREHLALVDLINRIAAAFGNGDRAVCRSLLTDLRTEMERHFANEEAFMESVDYPELVAHRRHHKECLDVLDGLSDIDAFLGESGTSPDVTSFQVLINDVAHADLKLQEFLARWPSVD
jgi:hemerythrin-like metal-binding protein